MNQHPQRSLPYRQAAAAALTATAILLTFVRPDEVDLVLNLLRHALAVL